MSLSRLNLEREAAATGFSAEALEKAIRLLSLLSALRSHPFLKGRIALKGGTALNLFLFDVPRLSVDIDLNYVGARDRETMLAERPRIEEAIQAVCGREGLVVKRVPTEHAGGKWRLTYTSVLLPSATLELDVNFLLRIPLWPVRDADSKAIGSFQATAVPLLDIHEIAAGKLAALLARNASRDVFDAVELLRRKDIEAAKLRLAFVFYGAANRRDWRTVSAGDVRLDPDEVRREVAPMLRSRESLLQGDIARSGEALVNECRDRLSVVLPLNEKEMEFLTRLNDRGVIAPELLTADEAMQATIREQPTLLWKALNVGRRGRPPAEEEVV